MARVRTLKAGTILYGKGSAIPVSLAKDAEVTFPIDSDEHFVGWLLPYQQNWDLNIGSVDGQWDRVTGRQIPPETGEPATPPMELASAQSVPPLVMAIRLAMNNNWVDALACYDTAKVSLALTDAELVAKGNSPKEKAILQKLADGVDGDGQKIFTAAEVEKKK